MLKGLKVKYIQEALEPVFITDRSALNDDANKALDKFTGGLAQVFYDFQRLIKKDYRELVEELTTDDIEEGSLNLYHTDTRVRQTTLTGFVAGPNATMNSTDTVLSALEKAQGQIDAITAGAGSSTNLAITGTTGNGYIDLPYQTSTPSTPGTGVLRVYVSSTGQIGWRGPDGFTRLIDGTANSANRVYTLPNVAGTFITTGNLTDITVVGTIVTGTWQGTAIADAYISSATVWNAKVGSVTGTAGRITIGGTGTAPTVDIAGTYVGQNTITTLGTIGTGVWQGSSISTTYTDAKVISISGTSARVTIGGTATVPTVDISSSYVGQATITTLGTIATGVWNGTAVSLTYGGTNASLAASTGGVVYSTNTAMAILAGTATARQMLQSGATAAPAWSTATYPATTTTDQILFSTSVNVIDGSANFKFNNTNQALTITGVNAGVGSAVPTAAITLNGRTVFQNNPSSYTLGGSSTSNLVFSAPTSTGRGQAYYIFTSQNDYGGGGAAVPAIKQDPFSYVSGGTSGAGTTINACGIDIGGSSGFACYNYLTQKGGSNVANVVAACINVAELRTDTGSIPGNSLFGSVNVADLSTYTTVRAVTGKAYGVYGEGIGKYADGSTSTAYGAYFRSSKATTVYGVYVDFPIAGVGITPTTSYGYYLAGTRASTAYGAYLAPGGDGGGSINYGVYVASVNAQYSYGGYYVNASSGGGLAYGVYCVPADAGSSSSTIAGGYFSIGAGGAAASNRYGVYVTSIAAATNSYGIYNDALAYNYIKGTLGLGIAPTTTDQLLVKGISSNNIVKFQSSGGTAYLTLSDGGTLTFGDALNIVCGTGTGTKIGTATGQKLGFWNATPVVQPTSGIAAAAFVANTSGIVDDSATWGGYTQGQIVAALKLVGALA